MPIKNYFPVFHKLRSGAYSYVWSEKCEQLLPKHYKERCLDYMLRQPEPVHWKPDTTKYTYDKHGTLTPVQNHPVRVRFPLQCNYGLWAGEGVVQSWSRTIKSKKHFDMMIDRVAKYHVPHLTSTALYSEILDKWFMIPCTGRAMDQIDDVFGLDYYILKTHERDLNSKLAMDLRRKMLLQLCDAKKDKLSVERQRVFNRYKDFMLPVFKRQWREPLFAPALWNVRDRALANEPRTNNHLEGWHRRFKTIVDKHHPNIFEFVDKLRGEQARMETLIEQLVAGANPVEPRQKREEAEWVGLSIKEALEKAEAEIEKPLPPLKKLIKNQFMNELKDFIEKEKAGESGDGDGEARTETQDQSMEKQSLAGKFDSPKRKDSAEQR